MTDNPLVSIVVPIYKVENYLEECIQSLLQQTYRNIEIILVDDGSPDNCPKICDNYSKTDNRIKVVHKKNNGVSEARNTGIEKSSGQYIVFIDGDDVLDHNCIQQLVLAHDGKDSTISATGYERFTTAADLSSIVFHCNHESITPTQLIQRRKGYFCWSCLFPKDLLMRHTLKFPKKISNLEDVVFLGKTLLFVKNVIYVPAPFYQYRITPASMTSNCINHEWQAESWWKAYLILLDDINLTLTFVQKIQYFKLLQRCLNNFYDECYIGNLQNNTIQAIKGKYKNNQGKSTAAILSLLIHTIPFTNSFFLFMLKLKHFIH